jgi:release factor glutamine methyltransferase
VGSSETILNYDQLVSSSQLARSEARLLLAHLLKKDKTWLLAHGDEPASIACIEQARALFLRRQNGEPIAYLLGSKEFYGRNFEVGPGVLIPRPETELLVDWGIEALQARGLVDSMAALDLGCGSGCLGLSLALEAVQRDVDLAEITLSDLSADALQFTHRNASALGAIRCHELTVNLRLGHWLSCIDPAARFDLILSNPPYIRLSDQHLREGDLRFEPTSALSSGESGLHALIEIIAEARNFLKPGAKLLLEHGYDQAEAVRDLLSEHGYVDIETRQDLSGIERATGGAKAIA